MVAVTVPLAVLPLSVTLKPTFAPLPKLLALIEAVSVRTALA